MSNKSFVLVSGLKFKWANMLWKLFLRIFSSLTLSFNSLDVLWVSPSQPVSSLESCSSVTALPWVNLEISFDAGVLTIVIGIIIVITHTVTQAVEDLWLEMVQAWVLVCLSSLLWSSLWLWHHPSTAALESVVILQQVPWAL